MDGPLKNLLVIDLTRVLVGPYCTMVLSDLGARVIKVEAPEIGDDSRKFGPFIKDYSAYFMSLNRGKESIALNLKNTDDWVKSMEKEKIPCGPIFNIKEAVENPQVESRNMIVKAYHKVIGDFKLAGNPIKMSSYKDEKTRGDIPDLDEHREKILKEFS